MPDAKKDMLLRWLPAIVAIVGFVGNAVYIGRWIGQVEQRVAVLEKQPTRSEDAAYFVTRTEFNAQKENRDRQLGELTASLNRMDAKLDRLIEREIPPKKD